MSDAATIHKHDLPEMIVDTPRVQNTTMSTFGRTARSSSSRPPQVKVKSGAAGGAAQRRASTGMSTHSLRSLSCNSYAGATSPHRSLAKVSPSSAPGHRHRRVFTYEDVDEVGFTPMKSGTSSTEPEATSAICTCGMQVICDIHGMPGIQRAGSGYHVEISDSTDTGLECEEHTGRAHSTGINRTEAMLAAQPHLHSSRSRHTVRFHIEEPPVGSRKCCCVQ